jgi:hypothetical protein
MGVWGNPSAMGGAAADHRRPDQWQGPALGWSELPPLSLDPGGDLPFPQEDSRADALCRKVDYPRTSAPLAQKDRAQDS